MSKRRRYARGISWLVAGCFLVAFLALRLMPIPAALLRPPEPSLRLVDRHGERLRELLVDKSRFASSVTLGQVPQSLIDATIAAEDKRFWSHAGIDLFALGRAVSELVRHGRVHSGASTITQQLVKIAEHGSDRTLSAKIHEAIAALRLEQAWTKQRILEEYLNRLDYGNLRVGCESAAEYYFGKPLKDLSLAEAAFLAGLPQAPARLNPYLHLERAKQRQALVLARMVRAGKATEGDARRAQWEDLRLCAARRTFEAPHFVDLLLGQTDRAQLAPAEVRTTLDLPLNRALEGKLHDRIERLHEHAVRNGAVVVIENKTGNVLALVGSENYFAPGAGQVNGAWARRSPGSTIKPFTYLLAFERGATPASIVADLPAAFATSTGIYRPDNYDHRCYGPMRYRLALANSLNISAVKVLNEINGATVLQKRLRQCGLTSIDQSADNYGLGLTIGNAEARLLELTNAYACLARMGEYRPYSLLGGESSKRVAIQVCQPAAAYLIADILSDNTARTFTFGAQSPLRFDFPVACKTGTSTDFRDNWAFGYTPEFTVGVWVGNFDGQPMEHISGVTGAGPILHDAFEFLHENCGTSWYADPVNIVEAKVHPITGKLLNHSLAEAVTEKFIEGNLPPTESASDYNEAGHVRLPSIYRDWLASGANWTSDRVVTDGFGAASELRIVRPLPGTVCVLDSDVPTSNELTLATAGSPRATWKSDTLAIRSGTGKTCAILREGRHQLTVSDPATGMTKQTWITVKSL